MLCVYGPDCVDRGNPSCEACGRKNETQPCPEVVATKRAAMAAHLKRG